MVRARNKSARLTGRELAVAALFGSATGGLVVTVIVAGYALSTGGSEFQLDDGRSVAVGDAVVRTGLRTAGTIGALSALAAVGGAGARRRHGVQYQRLIWPTALMSLPGSLLMFLLSGLVLSVLGQADVEIALPVLGARYGVGAGWGAHYTDMRG